MRRTLSICVITLALLLLPSSMGEASFTQTIPGRGAATTLDIASWNIEWFGDTGNGPTNEALQLQNARAVIAGADMDIWGVAEIVSLSQWNNLKSQLSGYAGFLAKEPNVVNGAAFYSDFSDTEQNVGILYKTSIATVTDARVILTSNDSNFAGRPPLQVTLRVTLNGVTENIIVIVLHAKCCSDSDSLTRRRNASNALKSYLDSNFPTQKVWVIGDFNDDVDTSITSGNASPYANFVNDTARYRFPTKALSDAGISSTISFSDTIDHHLNSNEANATYIAGSAEVFRVDSFISNYGNTTGDHFPVLSRYTFGGGGGAPAQLIINEIRANEPGSNTAGEFVELVNIGGTAVNIGGWTISDSLSARHTFASGTTLNPGKAIVVFGGASAIPSGLSNAVAASSGALGFNNDSDTVTLRDSGGTSRNSFAYSSTLSGTDGVSMNRSPDGTTGGFVLHTSISSAQSSPGTRASGAAW
jgi:lamin tail-like protein/endonuclease/exonuclease/phosphatase family protein